MKKYNIIFLISFFLYIATASQSFSPEERGNVLVIVDGDPPVINIISPLNTTYNNATPLLVNYTISDQSLDSIWYSINNQQNITISSPFYLDLAEGNYIIRIYANDSFNRINFSEVYFSINNSIVFCGNNISNAGESCTNCQIDCGVCPPSTPPGSSGGETIEIKEPAKNETPPTQEDILNKTKPNKTAPEQETAQEDIKRPINLYIIFIPALILIIIIITTIILLIIYEKEKEARRKTKNRTIFKA